ncbi:hypothetical protein ACPCIU_14750 [Streptomyces seoulensis]|uniref:hypothetical protein n=1 Tax=Streptomyces seoulensis TaxID=73044 RepID=UPI003C306653
MEIAGRALPEGSWWDWEVLGWDAGRFRLAAGHNLTHHHGLEVHFLSPALVSCPFVFQDPVFRPPTAEERAGLARSLGEDLPLIVAFEADGGGSVPVSCLIAAEGVEIRPGLVRREVPGRPDWPGVHLVTD